METVREELAGPAAPEAHAVEAAGEADLVALPLALALLKSPAFWLALSIPAT